MFGSCWFGIPRARARSVAFSFVHRPPRALLAPRAWSVSLAASLLLSALSLCAGAAAEESGHAAGASRASAESLFETGLELQRLGQLEQACERFEASAELAALPHALLQVGNCRERSDPLGALASFEAALAAAAEVTDSTRRRAYEDAAKKRIAPLEARIPTLTIHSPPEGVRVEVAAEGKPARVVTRFGEPQRFNPGKYRLTASAQGTEEYRLELELRDAQRLELDIPLLDPLQPEQPALGAAAAPPEERSNGLHFGTLPVALAGTGGALVLTSLITGRVSSSARGKLERECTGPDELTGLRACNASLADTKQRVEDYALATDLLWISGTLLAGAGVTWFLLDQNRGNEPESPALSAGCSAAACGVSMTGSF